MKSAVCHECQTIAQEIWDAYDEMRLELASNPEAREAWLARKKLIGGTEEDAALAEELFSKVRIKSSERVRLAIGRKFVHEASTGHKVPAGYEMEE